MHFNHDSQNSFSVHHDSQTPKMVDHGVMKISLPPPPLPQNKEGRKGKKYCHVQLGVVMLISLLLWAAVMFYSNSFSNEFIE